MYMTNRRAGEHCATSFDVPLLSILLMPGTYLSPEKQRCTVQNLFRNTKGVEYRICRAPLHKTFSSCPSNFLLVHRCMLVIALIRRSPEKKVAQLEMAAYVILAGLGSTLPPPTPSVVSRIVVGMGHWLVSRAVVQQPVVASVSSVGKV